MIKCTKCGEDIRDDSKFCPNCGNKVEKSDKDMKTNEQESIKTNNSIKKRPFYKKVWFWVVVSMVGLIVISNGEGDNINSSSNNYISTSSISVDNANYIGEEVECSNWKLRVSDVKTANMTSDRSETTWFYITFYATNIGNKEDYFKPSYISISNGEVTYSNIELLGNEYFERSRLCQPFIEEKFTIVFEVPRGSDYQDFTFNVKFIVNSTNIFLKNRT